VQVWQLLTKEEQEAQELGEVEVVRKSCWVASQ
jgi:hypothetical protein